MDEHVYSLLLILVNLLVTVGGGAAIWLRQDAALRAAKAAKILGEINAKEAQAIKEDLAENTAVTKATSADQIEIKEKMEEVHTKTNGLVERLEKAAGKIGFLEGQRAGLAAGEGGSDFAKGEAEYTEKIVKQAAIEVRKDAPATGKRWLVIEDDVTQRETYSILLKGDDVAFAAGLPTALGILGAGGVDGVIADLYGTGGVKTVLAVREQFPAVPVVVLTGVSNPPGFAGDLMVEVLIKGEAGPLEARATLLKMLADLAQRPKGTP